MAKNKPARALAVKQPQDHKPKQTEKVTVQYLDQKYRVHPKAVTDLRVLDLLESERLISALRLILGADQYERFLVSVTDEDGHASVEHAGGLLEQISRAVGAKN